MQFTVSEAKAQFAALLKRAAAGENVVVTRHGKPVARITGVSKPQTKSRIGALKGKIWMSDDFDEPLEEFRDYQP